MKKTYNWKINMADRMSIRKSLKMIADEFQIEYNPKLNTENLAVEILSYEFIPSKVVRTELKNIASIINYKWNCKLSNNQIADKFWKIIC